MDNLQPFGAEGAADHAAEDDEVFEAPPSIGTDERRMHVRAYNYWASLLGNRAYPSVDDLEPDELADFGPNSVLLDFTSGVHSPAIAWLGKTLREECEVDETIHSVADVPNRSLLSRLTDHYMQIIANQAPVGFEAEFVNQRGINTLYRGILMPFSSSGDAIDFIYGVINWKEVADSATQDAVHEELGRTAARPKAQALGAGPIWADGPSGNEIPSVGFGGEGGADAADGRLGPDVAAEPETLADYLDAARASADEAKAAHGRSRAALYQALGQAYDFALAADVEPEIYEELLEESGIVPQARAPMTPIVKLVFGADYDKTRLTEFAAALTHGRRESVAAGEFGGWLNAYKGGLKAVVAAERALRRPAKADALADAYEALRGATIQGFVTLGADAREGEEFVLLVGRRMPDGRFAVVGAVPHDQALCDRAVRKLAH